MIPHERRACERYPGDSLLCFSSPLAGEPVAGKAHVHDVSPGGIGLYVGPLGWSQPGEELAVALPGEEFGRWRGARVAHVSWQDDGWLLGCVWREPLSIEDLEWLRQSEPAGTA